MMKGILLAGFMACSVSALQSQWSRKFHFKSVVIDTHNDVLTAAVEDGHAIDGNLKGKTHSDLRRFMEGGVDVQIFSVWCDGTYGNGKAFARANREIDTLYAVAARNPERMMIVQSPAELKTALRQKKLGAMIGVEGGHMIEDRLDYLDSLYRRGTRYMTLTWNNSTSWATSAMDESSAAFRTSERKLGLTDFGRQVVKRMNELGMIVDLSHVGEQTLLDALNTSTKPVIASHSCVHAICPVFRNLKDAQIRAIAKNGGVIHLNFFSGFVDSSFNRIKIRPPLSALLDHLDYIVKLVGVDHVGLGSDFDGITSAPQQLDDVTSYPLITQELFKRGYSKKAVRKILGGNFMRVFQANSK
jgi:membrane dipeptidase